MILVGVAALARPNAAGGVPYLFVGDGGAGWACEVNDFETFEADFAAPSFKIGGRIIERIAEFDQHVERHQQTKDILAARIIDKRFDGNERAAGRKRVVDRAYELHLFLKIPVVQDHSHRDQVGLGQWIFEEVALSS